MVVCDQVLRKFAAILQHNVDLLVYERVSVFFMPMLYHHLTLALRRVARNRAFSLLHVGGLTVGIATALLLFAYTASEWRYNRFHQKLPRLYRVLLEDQGQRSEYTPPALAPWLKREFGEVANFLRTNSNGEGSVSYRNQGIVQKSFREQNLAYADGSIFSMFTCPAAAGSPTLDLAQQVAISASYAQKYFGSEPALGKTLLLDNQFGALPYTVTGVFKDLPAASDYQFDLLFSLSTLENPANLNGNDWAALDNWHSASYLTFLELTPDANPDALAQKAQAAFERLSPDNKVKIHLQALSEVHLGKSTDDPNPTFGNRALLLALSGVALLILLIAWINYINLATAQGLEQARRVGIRRMVGASRLQVAVQYLMESLLLTALAALCSMVLVWLLTPAMSTLTGKVLEPSKLLFENSGLVLGGLLLFGTLVSGAYVAWLLSGFEPMQLFQNAGIKVSGKSLLRNALIVGQFGISIAFIIAALVFRQQLHFMRNSPLGMNIEQILVLRGPDGQYQDRKDRLANFRAELEKQSWIKQNCFTGCLPGATFTQNFSTEGFTSAMSDAGVAEKSFVVAMIDHQFQPTYELALAGGRNFTETDARKGYAANDQLMLNETAARLLGFDNPAEATGRPVRWGNERTLYVAGVFKDYHHRGLQQAIDPMIFLPSMNSGLISLRFDPVDVPGKIAQLQQLYKQFFPNDPFDYYFESEDFDKQYAEEKRLGTLSSLASLVAILLSCLGLLGLITFAVAQRTKEIGIRKVLGASSAGIARLLATDFLKLVALSIALAAPVAYYFLQKWLADFAYRIELSGWFFAGAGAATLLIAALTVGYQSIQAALANPVNSLRNH